jgi:hypothetical protein
MNKGDLFRHYQELNISDLWIIEIILYHEDTLTKE